MDYLAGVAVGLAAAGFAALSGFDRDRAFYPTLLVVIALYYELFAAMAGSGSALAAECVGLALFSGIAVIGFRASLWFAVAGLAGHGLFDLFRGDLIENPGVPAWWPGFCSAADLALAACLAALLVTRRTLVKPSRL